MWINRHAKHVEHSGPPWHVEDYNFFTNPQPALTPFHLSSILSYRPSSLLNFIHIFILGISQWRHETGERG